jgi:O-antigen ligase
MNSAKIRWTSGVLMALACLAMLSEWLRGMDLPILSLGGFREELIGIMLSRSGQCLLLLCLLSWYLTLLWIKAQGRAEARRQGHKWQWVPTGEDACKALLVALVVVAYIGTGGDIEQPGKSSSLLLGIDQSTNLLVLVAGIVVSQIAGILLPRDDREGVLFRAGILVCLVVFLAASSLARFPIPHTYLYRSQVRWTGLWVNPNTFGVLMGAGAVAAVGLILASVQAGRFRGAIAVLLGAAAVFMGVGLLHSYSRGAWAGFGCGLFYLGFWLMRASGIQKPKVFWWIRRNAVSSFLIACLLALVAFWQFHDTEDRLARRAFSVRSQNDFSLGNRLAAYEGALQMMADQPWFGVGWNKPESSYTGYYRPVKVEEGMAIQLNDFFTLGTTLGLPALFCFVVYVGIGFKPKGTWRIRDGIDRPVEDLNSGRNQMSVLKATCRAGAIVLLVGFFFDGGLFKIALAVPFWILLELGSVGNREIHEPREHD